MKIIAMMAFYDEPEELLKRSVRGMASLGVNYLVAGDGAYDLYPDGLPYSDPDSIYGLGDACIHAGLQFEIIQPFLNFPGNEVEKRQAMLDRALELANEDDWLVIWDCDYKLVSAPSWKRTARALRSTGYDAVTIDFTEDPRACGEHDFYPMGMFIRAIPGIKMDGNHHTYVFPDGRRTQVLRRPVPNEADALYMPDVKILHDVHARDPKRRASQTAYYQQRDALGVES